MYRIKAFMDKLKEIKLLHPFALWLFSKQLPQAYN